MDTKILEIIKSNNMLCLDVDDPSWDNARGYVLDENNQTLFFPLSGEYLKAQELGSFRVLIWSNPRVIITGQLEQGTTTTEEAALIVQQKLMQGVTPEDAERMVYDQRNGQPRKNGCKLHIRLATILESSSQ